MYLNIVPISYVQNIERYEYYAFTETAYCLQFDYQKPFVMITIRNHRITSFKRIISGSQKLLHQIARIQ